MEYTFATRDLKSCVNELTYVIILSTSCTVTNLFIVNCPAYSRMNQKLEQYLRMFIDHRQEQWLEWLGTAEFAYNNKVQTSMKVSPFKANSG